MSLFSNCDLEFSELHISALWVVEASEANFSRKANGRCLFDEHIVLAVIQVKPAMQSLDFKGLIFTAIIIHWDNYWSGAIK